ncbi:MAG: hypothetical protein ACK4GN_08525 [Runella sp.]
MRKLLILFVIFHASLLVAKAQFNNWAVGFQLVEPSGLNVRKYYGDTKALDLSVGTYGLFYRRDIAYRRGHYHNAGLSIRVTHLWHRPVFKSEKLHGYFGFGGQVNSRRYYFESRNLSGVLEFDNNISLGGAGLAGLEYFVPSSPLSCFLETGLYVEVLPAPLFLHPQGSFGVRFNF